MRLALVASSSEPLNATEEARFGFQTNLLPYLQRHGDCPMPACSEAAPLDDGAWPQSLGFENVLTEPEAFGLNAALAGQADDLLVLAHLHLFVPPKALIGAPTHRLIALHGPQTILALGSQKLVAAWGAKESSGFEPIPDAPPPPPAPTYATGFHLDRYALAYEAWVAGLGEAQGVALATSQAAYWRKPLYACAGFWVPKTLFRWLQALWGPMLAGSMGWEALVDALVCQTSAKPNDMPPPRVVLHAQGYMHDYADYQQQARSEVLSLIAEHLFTDPDQGIIHDPPPSALSLDLSPSTPLSPSSPCSPRPLAQHAKPEALPDQEGALATPLHAGHRVAAALGALPLAQRTALTGPPVPSAQSIKRVLDIGAGEGGFACGLRALAPRLDITLCEPSPAAARARAKGFVVVDQPLEQAYQAGALGKEPFDLISLLDVLEHVDNPLSLLQAAHRLLRPQGYLLLSVPNQDFWQCREAMLHGAFAYTPVGPWCITHRHFFTAPSLLAMLAQAGFTVERWAAERIPVAEDFAKLLALAGVEGSSAGQCTEQAGDRLESLAFHVLATRR